MGYYLFQSVKKFYSDVSVPDAFFGVSLRLTAPGRRPAGFAVRSALRALTPLRVPHAVVAGYLYGND